jgi:hypothetical protein
MKGVHAGQFLIWKTIQTIYWFVKLPKSKDYQISMTTSSLDTYSTLLVEIPANINFQSRESSTKIEGFLRLMRIFIQKKIRRIDSLLLLALVNPCKLKSNRQILRRTP